MAASNLLCYTCFREGHISQECPYQHAGLKFDREPISTPPLVRHSRPTGGEASKEKDSLHTPDSLQKYLNGRRSPHQDLNSIHTPTFLNPFKQKALFQVSSQNSNEQTVEPTKKPRESLFIKTPISNPISNLSPVNQPTERSEVIFGGQSLKTKNEERQCPGCEKFYEVDSEEFMVHIRVVHKIDLESAAYKFFLRKHQNMKTRKVKKIFTCKTCTKNYKDPDSVKRCMLRHAKDTAPKETFGPSRSTSGTSSVQQEKEKCLFDSCKDSSKVYKNRKTLLKHHREAHHVYTRKLLGHVETSEEDSGVIYNCSFCGKVLCHSGNLRRHEKICKKRRVQESNMQSLTSPFDQQALDPRINQHSPTSPFDQQAVNPRFDQHSHSPHINQQSLNSCFDQRSLSPRFDQQSLCPLKKTDSAKFSQESKSSVESIAGMVFQSKNK